ncbi:Pr6Pr family membrane protein [Spiroplasma culicicola]|uniref:Transmembrane protein n=1 Tax=Spiroplasma culicicola AES-1 TaxID=1276246 RepID=W6A8G4_9MOLU|nr:Pr6Pr family membrane protein [Spiroplasma culicicola]AHI53246.1 hypothetical protein SCULI_v1c09060 [Spiroplasma culicicola AES-1]
MKYKQILAIYKWLFGLLSFATIVSYYIYNIVEGSEIKNVYSGSYETYTIDYFTTFTLLSNVLACSWFLTAAIKPKKEGSGLFLSYTSANSIATMITVTFLIYNFVLVPLDTGFPSHPVDQTNTIINHIITPIAFVIYAVVLMPNKSSINLNEFFIKRFWIQFTMVLGYCIFAMVRGELRYNSGEEYQNILYPYFFLNIHAQGPLGIAGIGWFFIAFFGIIGLLIGFSYLYNYLSNLTVKSKFYTSQN